MEDAEEQEDTEEQDEEKMKTSDEVRGFIRSNSWSFG